MCSMGEVCKKQNLWLENRQHLEIKTQQLAVQFACKGLEVKNVLYTHLKLYGALRCICCIYDGTHQSFGKKIAQKFSE